jgi:predicted CoA-substrate-specific enzyme activase
MGAHFLLDAARTIVDIGGQDSKAIKVDPDTGRVVEFVMNDKCAAGTGRFLEKIAELLDYSLDELGPRSLESTKTIEISSQCVVFAESEVISLKARGERREDIAAAVHLASARRVRNLVNRLGLEPELVFSGGVSNNVGMRKALEQTIGHPMRPTRLDMVYAGALGAAVLAQRHAERRQRDGVATSTRPAGAQAV